MANNISTNNNFKNLDIFSVSDMEIVMKGGDPSKACYNYTNSNLAGQIGRGSLSTTEKDRIYNYTVLNTGNFENNCKGLDETAGAQFRAVIDELNRLKESCNEDALSINGETMQEDFDEIVKEIEGYLLQINEYTDALIARGKAISEKQKVVYNETVKWMNFLYESKKPEVKLVTNPGNLTPVK